MMHVCLQAELLFCGHFHSPEHDVAQNKKSLVKQHSWPFKSAKVPRPSAINLQLIAYYTAQSKHLDAKFWSEL